MEHNEKNLKKIDDADLKKVNGGVGNEADLSGYKGSWARFVEEVLGEEDPVPPGLWWSEYDPYRKIRE